MLLFAETLPTPAVPWRVLAPSAKTLGRYVAPDASYVIEFHLAVQGSGYVRVGEETTPFSAGGSTRRTIRQAVRSV